MFEFNETQYQKTFKSKGKFEHSKGKFTILFPFATDTGKVDEAKPVLKDFKSISGALHRYWLNKDVRLSSSNSEFVEELIGKVQTDQNAQLRDIIEKIIFDRNETLVIFDKAIIPFVARSEKNPKINNLIDFLFHLFYSEEFALELREEFTLNHKSNTLHNMVLDHLDSKASKSISIKKNKAYFNGNISEDFRAKFQQDYRLLLSKPNLFKDNVHNLIKYYYFSYILNFAISLNKSFNPRLNIKLFFTLEWEKLSESRIAVENGYKKLENLVSDLFSHSNCLELLNLIDFSAFYPGQIVLYEDILNLCETATEQEVLSLEASLIKLYSRYKKEIDEIEKGRLSWDDQSFINPINQNEITDEPQAFKLVRKLFNALKYQFERTGRKSASTAYNQWYKEFVLQNYCKGRGPLGNTLSLNKETLLLFTELAILNQKADKILITTLWEELESRNINLDNQSKQTAINFFQKINILEKKSDSGDAQYVTKMYN